MRGRVANYVFWKCQFLSISYTSVGLSHGMGSTSEASTTKTSWNFDAKLAASCQF